eukprot:GHVL01028290.1.p1 GENE.GHVL01028290.1~~GHVL01028290.1.p1  ORF type:complete len:109 (-),score=21.79 GHVL01028290.1:369-695(-)
MQERYSVKNIEVETVFPPIEDPLADSAFFFYRSCVLKAENTIPGEIEEAAEIEEIAEVSEYQEIIPTVDPLTEIEANLYVSNIAQPEWPSLFPVLIFQACMGKILCIV